MGRFQQKKSCCHPSYLLKLWSAKKKLKILERKNELAWKLVVLEIEMRTKRNLAPCGQRGDLMGAEEVTVLSTK